MSLERLERLIARFRERVLDAGPGVTGTRPWTLEPELGLGLLDSMLLARQLDLMAHRLRAAGDGHYTICSAGHEANVVLGRLTGPSDPSLVHYRSAALQLERARQVSGDPVLDIALSLVASADDPLSGGRHKAFGGKALGIVPQTSTIASHLPRAVGMAFALERRARLGLAKMRPSDSIVLASFGDASLNHSTALGALNAASFALHQSLPVPVLFVCEDNGLGISVRTPPGWIATRLQAQPHLRYFAADGWDLDGAFRAAEAAVRYCRTTRRAAVLHLSCVRLLGHAGSDADQGYRTPAEISEAEDKDPVLACALSLLAASVTTPGELLEREERAAERAAEAAATARIRPKLQSRTEVMAPIARPIDEQAVLLEARRQIRAEPNRSLTLAQGINHALAEALERYPELIVFGEDVAKKGGVYGVTKGLLDRAGPKRVFNTLLDEQTILGLALGAANEGLLPVPEIQYLAYLHNAEDQLRGEATTLPFFSNGQFDNPLLLRIAGLAYQQGFGGHFHNDNSLAVLRDLPGLVVCVPARADDAVELYRTALALCVKARRVVVSVEPIALYHVRDLHEPGDGAWAGAASGAHAELGRARIYHPDAEDLTIVTYGNGLFMSLRVAARLAGEHGISARVLDLRWLAPLPIDDVLSAASDTGRLLVVDECRRSGNVSEALMAELFEAGGGVIASRVTSADSFIPLGDAARQVLVSEPEILEAALALARRAPG